MSNVVPLGWRETTIGELTSENSLFSDGDWVESKDQDPDGLNRLIQLADIGDGIFIDKSTRYLNDEQFRRLKCTPLQKGDILIARMPDPLGRACIFPKVGGKFATVVDVAIIRTENADHNWLMSAINSSDFRSQIELNASGTTRTRIARGSLAQIPLVAPPIQEQQKIAAILTSVDDVIETTQAQINKLKDLKTGMMQELLTKGIGHTEFKDSPVGRIPKSWVVISIGDLGNVITGNTPKTLETESYGGMVPFVSPGDIGDHMYVDRTKSTLTELGLSKTRALPQNSVLVVCIGSTIGKTGITTKTCATNQQVNAILCINNNYKFVYYLMTFYSKVIKGMAGTQAIPIINKSDFSSLLVQRPPIEEQALIAEAIAGVDSKINLLERKFESLVLSKKALMQDLLTGKVRVQVN